MARVTAAYQRLFKDTKGFRTVSCLENTVGSGANLGGPFEQLAELRSRIIDATGAPQRIGFCFDSCHAHAFGHDMSSRAAAVATLKEFDRLCGLGHLKVMHLNDSKAPRGSHLDRHEHIGQGTLSPRSLADSGFAALVNHPALRGIPKILETPKGNNPAGTPHDSLNLQRLRKLQVSKQPIKTRRGRSNAARTRRQPAELP
jgi:deoxyribonuclease-4